MKASIPAILLALLFFITTSLPATLTKNKFGTTIIERWNKHHEYLIQEAQKEKIDLTGGLAAIFKEMHDTGAEAILNDENAMEIANKLLNEFNTKEDNTASASDAIAYILRDTLYNDHNQSLSILDPEQYKSKHVNVMADNITMMQVNIHLDPQKCSTHIKAAMIIYAFFKQAQECNWLTNFLLQYDFGTALLRSCGVLT